MNEADIMAIVMVIDNGPGIPPTYIDDSCCVKTKEENDRILKRVGEIYYEAMLKKYMEESESDRQSS